ncbi:MAG: HEAT repeat domain-containing protein [Acidobacteriia bacterium]|nr:HEAT repeat domain-containing protein [Terriglobia bacterium]
MTPAHTSARRTRPRLPAARHLAALLLLVCAAALSARGDESYARSRDYDLQHSKIALQFDLGARKVLGDVTHTLAVLREGAARLAFDSVGLTIQSVTLNGEEARFETTADQLLVPLPAPAHSGEKFTVEIRYEGQPKKGLYFILPDKNYPNRPKQIWTQGESEDTRYYLPTYDYPNDRLTTEMLVTVPAGWLTVSNGKLVSVRDAGQGQKTWRWVESVPSSTYLISLVAGEFDEVQETWRGKPVTYYAPRGRGERLAVNYSRTPAMLDLFSKKLGVDYPWEKYAQAMVDDFVAGGMENSSATTNTSSSLVHPKLAPEYVTNEDNLISHELAHQWFGDLLTCKDWGNIWLNEGFATFFEYLWTESHYGKDQAAYERWNNARGWFSQPDLFAKPIVRYDFNDSSEFDGNAYGKGGWVLFMLRERIGEEAFFRGMKHYLEANRGKNVVTADFARAVEEATSDNIDQFLAQWVYGAGAPQFDLRYAYDAAKKEVRLEVKQTQKLEGRVGLFRVPVEVEVTTASGAKSFPITVAKEAETFTFPADTAPLLVLFDKGGKILKSAEFHKETKEWIYQLKNAAELADRADAALALAKMKNDDAVLAALGESLQTDRAWGVRVTAADSLGEIGGPAAAKLLLAALEKTPEPWVRNRIVSALGKIKEDTAVAAKLEAIARDDRSFRARAAALQALGRLKTPGAYALLTAAAAADSPDDFLRQAALRAYGSLGDEKAVPVLLEWSAPGKPFETRQAAMSSLGRLQKSNHDITRTLVGYLQEPYFSVRFHAVFVLGERGDAEAIPALQALLKSGDLSITFAPMVEEQIARLKKPEGEKGGAKEDSAAGDAKAVVQRLEKLERTLGEMNERLKSIESRLPPAKQ